MMTQIAMETHIHPFYGPGEPVPEPIWILLKQERVSGSGISWAVCKSTPSLIQISMPTPHHSVFCRPDALPVTKPTVSKYWRLGESEKYV